MPEPGRVKVFPVTSYRKAPGYQCGIGDTFHFPIIADILEMNEVHPELKKSLPGYPQPLSSMTISPLLAGVMSLTNAGTPEAVQ